MKTMLRAQLKDFVMENYDGEAETILSYLPPFPVDSSGIKAVMVNEVAADTPENDFYSPKADNPYMATTSVIFHKAGFDVGGIHDIIEAGIYITNVVKIPKEGTAIDTAAIKHYVPILQKELGLFPSLKAIMLMGDVARKAMNMIAKAESKKNAIPATSTYKLRHEEIVYKGIRMMPAYIMTGKNLAIEKSKTEMSAEEVAKMLQLIGYEK